MAILPNINQQNQGLTPQLPRVGGPQQQAATIQSQLTPAFGRRDVESMAPDNGQWGGPSRYMTPGSGALGNSVNRNNNPYSDVASISPFGNGGLPSLQAQYQQQLAASSDRNSRRAGMPGYGNWGGSPMPGPQPAAQGPSPQLPPIGPGTQGFEEPTNVEDAQIIDPNSGGQQGGGQGDPNAGPSQGGTQQPPNQGGGNGGVNTGPQQGGQGPSAYGNAYFASSIAPGTHFTGGQYQGQSLIGQPVSDGTGGYPTQWNESMPRTQLIAGGLNPVQQAYQESYQQYLNNPMGGGSGVSNPGPGPETTPYQGPGHVRLPSLPPSPGDNKGVYTQPGFPSPPPTSEPEYI